MSVNVRPATAADLPAIAEFTTGTFAWGDYVGDAIDGWLTDDDGRVLVGATVDDAPVALARGVFLSPSELWLHAARVHPDWRGQGIASLLNSALVDWGREHGAQVVRLLIEDWNEAAQRQVEKSRYRRVSQWVFGRRMIVADDPNPTRNGGKRVPGPERLQRASRSEAEPAFLAWSASQLLRSARGLFGRQWRWRRLTIDDLMDGAADGTFFECPSGWVLMSRADHTTLQISWMMATADDIPRLVRAILDYGLSRKVKVIEFLVPASDEMEAALERIGCELSPSAIWERPV